MSPDNIFVQPKDISCHGCTGGSRSEELLVDSPQRLSLKGAPVGNQHADSSPIPYTLVTYTTVVVKYEPKNISCKDS